MERTDSSPQPKRSPSPPQPGTAGAGDSGSRGRLPTGGSRGDAPPLELDLSGLDAIRDLAKRLNVDPNDLLRMAQGGQHPDDEEEEEEEVEERISTSFHTEAEHHHHSANDYGSGDLAAGSGGEDIRREGVTPPDSASGSVQRFPSEEKQPLLLGKDPIALYGQRKQSAFRGSQSTGSPRPFTGGGSTGGSPDAKKNKKKKKGNVQFTKNVIKDIHVYELDRTLHIDISFKRNKIGWVVLVFLLCIGTAWTTYGIWVSSVHKPKISLAILGLWASLIKLPCYWVVVIAMLLSGGSKVEDFKALKQFRVLVPTTALAVTATFGIMLEVVSALVAKNQVPAFSPTINLGLIWVMAYRRIRKRPTFMIEWLGAAVAVVGYTLSSWSQFTSSASVGEIIGANAVLLVCSVFFAAWVVLMEHCQHASPSVLVTYFPNSLTDVFFFFFIALVFEGPAKLKEASSWELFDPQYFPSGLLIALGGMVEMFLYLSAAKYLDILSILAVFAMKTILIPYIAYACVYSSWTATERTDKGVVFDLFLWLGTPIVLIGCMMICIFSSVKREFVARRLALDPSSLRRVRHPYRRGSDLASETSLKTTRGQEGPFPVVSRDQEACERGYLVGGPDYADETETAAI